MHDRLPQGSNLTRDTDDVSGVCHVTPTCVEAATMDDRVVALGRVVSEQEARLGDLEVSIIIIKFTLVFILL